MGLRAGDSAGGREWSGGEGQAPLKPPGPAVSELGSKHLYQQPLLMGC